jgi:hypothetical protein
MELMQQVKNDPQTLKNLNKRRIAGVSVPASFLVECVLSEVLPERELVEQISLLPAHIEILTTMYVFPFHVRILARQRTDYMKREGALTFRQFVILHHILQCISGREMVCPFLYYHPSYWYYYNLIRIERMGEIPKYINVAQVPQPLLQAGEINFAYASQGMMANYKIDDIGPYFGVILGIETRILDSKLEGERGMSTAPIELELGKLSLTEEAYFSAKIFWDFVYEIKNVSSRLHEAKMIIERARPLVTYIGDKIAHNYMNTYYEEEEKEAPHGMPAFMLEAMKEEEKKMYASMSPEAYSEMRKQERRKMLERLQKIESLQTVEEVQKWAKESGYNQPRCASNTHSSICTQGCPCCREMVAAKLAKEYAPYEWHKALGQFKIPEYKEKGGIYVVSTKPSLVNGVLSTGKTGLSLAEEDEEWENRGKNNYEEEEELCYSDEDCSDDECESDKEEEEEELKEVTKVQQSEGNEQRNDDLNDFELIKPDTPKEQKELIQDKPPAIDGLSKVLAVIPNIAEETLKKTLLIQPEIWNAYLNIDAYVAKHVFPKFYSEKISKFENILVTGRKETKYREMPQTFAKFAYLFFMAGWLDFCTDGSLMVGHPKALDKFALEISASPFGCTNLMISQGMVETVYMSEYAGEKSADSYRPPSTEAKNFVPKGVSTDISSVIEFIKANPNVVPMMDYIVIDIPLHRNSLHYYSMAEYGKYKKSKVPQEQVDDMPLGKADAQLRLLKLVAVLIKEKMKKGGSLVLKILETLRFDIVMVFYELIAGFFSNVKLILNPRSKDLSKEIYFIGENYSDVGFHNEKHRERVIRALGAVNNKLYSQLCRRLIATALQFGKKYTTNNQIGCRNQLRLLNCVQSLSEPVALKTWVNYKREKRGIVNM